MRYALTAWFERCKVKHYFENTKISEDFFRLHPKAICQEGPFRCVCRHFSNMGWYAPTGQREYPEKKRIEVELRRFVTIGGA